MGELERVLEDCGNRIGDAMAELRARLLAARQAGNEEAAAAAELLYLEAAGIQHARNKIIIAGIIESSELRALMDALRRANGVLLNDIKDIADLNKKIGTLRQTLATIENVVKQIATLVV